MQSHSRVHSRHAGRKAITPQILRRNKKDQPGSLTQRELDAVFGYGTSSSLPFFLAGVVSGIKRIFGIEKRNNSRE